jgi:hypothetical protein
MAWPKLRTNKSPGHLATPGNHSGAAPGEARPYGSAPDRATGGQAAGPPRDTGPRPGPAGPELEAAEPELDEAGAGLDEAGAGAQTSAEAAEAAERDDTPAFLDWGRSEDAAEPDGLQDAASSGGTGGGTVQAQAVPPKAEWKLVVTPVEGEPARPGIGQRRGNLAHLAANPRMRGWQRRAIIAIIVGVAFSLLVSWRLGLTLAVIAVIADTIYTSRRGLAGKRVKLTGAQRHTRRQLAKLGRAGYRAIHGNLIPESQEQIDHLVVGPAGVFAIDSESWDKHLVVRTKNGRQLWHGPFSMKERLEHARWESERAAEMLSGAVGSPVTVRPAMAVYGPKIPWDVATIREVDVFSGPRLRKYLRRRARQSGQAPLNDAEVERIYQAANQAFPHLTAGVRAS